MRFSMRPIDETIEDIRQQAQLNQGKKITSCFLQDGDALVLKTDYLLRILEAINQGFPDMQYITSYARADIMFSTYILQGSFMIAVTLFQSLGKAKKATWLVLFRQIILFIPLCVVLPMIGGMGIRGVWLAIALTDAILVAIIAFMVAYEFRKLPATSSVNR